MNSAVRAAILSPQSSSSTLKTALFHSTPVLGRKRRSFWESKHNTFNKRYRRLRGKQQLLRNVSAFADYLFQSWQDEFNNDDTSSSRSTSCSWFKRHHSRRNRRDKADSHDPRSWGRRHFEFCEDDDEFEIEYILRSGGFGGGRFSFWSFINDEEPQRGSSAHFSNSRRYWNWRYQEEDDYYSSAGSESSGYDMASDRAALGLSPSGPLNLEDVKSAYRTCALKWHPDRHRGSSKAAAEEKFKACSAAYQSLCDKLATS